MTSILFVDEDYNQIASSQMSSVPRVGEHVECSPVVGVADMFVVRSVTWQVFTDTPIANSAVVVLTTTAADTAPQPAEKLNP